MSKYKLDLSYCLTWYHSMDGLISHQELNALKPHCMNTITNWDEWHLAPGACGNGMTRPPQDIMSNTVTASMYGRTNPRRQLYRDRIVPTMRRTSSRSNLLSTIRTPKTILKYYQEFYSQKNSIKITSLLYTSDQSVYAWEQSDTIQIRTPEESRISRRSDLRFRRAAFNPYLRHLYTLHAFRRYQLSSIS